MQMSAALQWKAEPLADHGPQPCAASHTRFLQAFTLTLNSPINNLRIPQVTTPLHCILLVFSPPVWKPDTQTALDNSRTDDIY